MNEQRDPLAEMLASSTNLRIVEVRERIDDEGQWLDVIAAIIFALLGLIGLAALVGALL